MYRANTKQSGLAALSLSLSLCVSARRIPCHQMLLQMLQMHVSSHVRPAPGDLAGRMRNRGLGGAATTAHRAKKEWNIPQQVRTVSWTTTVVYM